MPALVTHHLFGCDALDAAGFDGLRRLTAQPVSRAAFLAGCQGPDPFFFAATSLRAGRMHRLARLMHGDRSGRALECLRAAAAAPSLPPGCDASVPWAFACGMLAHYALDRTAHPFVYAFEEELCRAENGLADAHHEVHALIESDIDASLASLGRAGGAESVALAVRKVFGDAAPLVDGPKGRGGLLAIETAVVSCAEAAFGVRLRAGNWRGSFVDMRRSYRAIEPAGSRRWRALGSVERVFRAHSMAQSLSHRPVLAVQAREYASPVYALNLDGRPWHDPHSGVSSDETFLQVYDRALIWYREALGDFLAGDACASIVAGVDHYGRMNA